MSDTSNESPVVKGAVPYDASSALALNTKAGSLLAGAKDYVIDSDDMLDLAGQDLREVKALQKQTEEQRTAITGPLNSALRAVNDLFRAPATYLEQAESVLKRAMVTYTTEQERIAAEARRRADAEARAERERQAAIERANREAAQMAERRAREAEQQALAAAAAGDAKAAAAAQAEVAAQVEQAAAANAEAEAAAQVAEIVSMAPAVLAPAKVTGISGRVNYSAQVDDLMVLIKAVAAGEAPIECITADTKFLGAQARAFKRAGQLFPGVSAVAERSISARAA